MAIIETDRLNGHNAARRVERPEEDVEPADRDPSRLPVNNLDAYKTWCQRVMKDWDTPKQ